MHEAQLLSMTLEMRLERSDHPHNLKVHFQFLIVLQSHPEEDPPSTELQEAPEKNESLQKAVRSQPTRKLHRGGVGTHSVSKFLKDPITAPDLFATDVSRICLSGRTTSTKLATVKKL